LDSDETLLISIGIILLEERFNVALRILEYLNMMGALVNKSTSEVSFIFLLSTALMAIGMV